MTQKLPSLHVPMYMHVLRDPIANLLGYLDRIHNNALISTLHEDKEFMTRAEKITRIFHEIYPTEDDQLGFYVDNDSFSFRRQNLLSTQTQVDDTKSSLQRLLKKSGSQLQYEFRLFDNILKEIVCPPFEATWFETPDRYFENGPLLLQMPTVLIQHAHTQKGFALEAEHEEVFQLKIDMNMIDTFEPVVDHCQMLDS